MGDSRYGMETLQVVKDLHAQGHDRFFVLMRHSLRHYGHDVNMEPFMGLTEEGKIFSHRLGTILPEGFNVRFFSSYIGRCIETAYMIDKGYSKKGGATLNNRLSREISPFYIVNFKKIIKLMKKYDIPTFIRRWIRGDFSPGTMMNAGDAAKRMMAFAVDRLEEMGENSMVISVTHDWNIFLVKEFGLGLTHEEYGQVQFLEGVVFFNKNGETFIANHQSAPRSLSDIWSN